MLENKQQNNFIIIENEDSLNNFIVNIRLLTLMQILLYMKMLVLGKLINTLLYSLKFRNNRVSDVDSKIYI